MPPTLVHVAIGVLIGVALLGAVFDRRSLAIVAIAAALPDLDAIVSLVVPGATNALFHSMFVPLAAAAVCYWDTEIRHTSWLRERAGWTGVRVGWVAIAAYAVAGIGLDLFNIESAAVLWPLSTRYYSIIGHFIISSQEGIIQTYIEIGDGWLQVASPGTTATHHVESWVNPRPGPSGSTGPRRVRLVDSGWQLVIVATAIVAIPAKVVLDREAD